MLSQFHTGNGLIAFSDPAGAKACLALATILKIEGYKGNISAYSNKEYDFYSDWDIPVSIIQEPDLSTLENKPDWIFTGTSHPESSKGFETKIIRQGLQMGIPTHAFIDHWTNLALRFNSGDGTVLPDNIWVVDEKARDLAINDGLPASKINLLTNPYLNYIATYWQPKLNADEILKMSGAPGRVKQFILYVPDPVSLRNDNGEWPFDEYSALHDIAEAMNDMKDIALMIKPHPLQPLLKLEEQIRRLSDSRKNSILFAPRVDNLGLAAAASLIIGFHSNFLIEGDAMGKKVLRYFPISDKQDAIAHLHIGKKVYDLQQLKSELNNIFLYEHRVS